MKLRIFNFLRKHGLIPYIVFRPFIIFSLCVSLFIIHTTMTVVMYPINIVYLAVFGTLGETLSNINRWQHGVLWDFITRLVKKNNLLLILSGKHPVFYLTSYYVLVRDITEMDFKKIKDDLRDYHDAEWSLILLKVFVLIGFKSYKILEARWQDSVRHSFINPYKEPQLIDLVHTNLNKTIAILKEDEEFYLYTFCNELTNVIKLVSTAEENWIVMDIPDLISDRAADATGMTEIDKKLHDIFLKSQL